MFKALKHRLAASATEDLRKEIADLKAEIGLMAETINDLDAENSALLTSLKTNHVHHAGIIGTLVDIVNAAVLAYGTEDGVLRLSGDTRAVAATLVEPFFVEQDDGDLVIRTTDDEEEPTLVDEE